MSRAVWRYLVQLRSIMSRAVWRYLVQLKSIMSRAFGGDPVQLSKERAPKARDMIARGKC